jgi:hypothetical protein
MVGAGIDVGHGVGMIEIKGAPETAALGGSW